jgi:hypothetical protein
MRIEPGDKTDEPIRTRGWTCWRHLFPPRHLLILGLLRKLCTDGNTLLMFSRVLNYTSKLCIWSTSKPGSGKAGEGGRTAPGLAGTKTLPPVNIPSMDLRPFVHLHNHTDYSCSMAPAKSIGS